MTTRNKTMLRKTAGFALLGVGVASIVLPVLPGITSTVIGLGLLSEHYPWARRTLNRGKRAAVKFRRRHPRLIRRARRGTVARRNKARREARPVSI